MAELWSFILLLVKTWRLEGRNLTFGAQKGGLIITEVGDGRLLSTITSLEREFYGE